jgi:hypothetical protein
MAVLSAPRLDVAEVSDGRLLVCTELLSISSMRSTISLVSGKDHFPLGSAFAGTSSWKELPPLERTEIDIVELTGYSGDATVMERSVQVPTL